MAACHFIPALAPRMIELWFWEIRHATVGRWRKTRYRTREHDALERFGADVRGVEWSCEVRDGDPDANSTSAFLRAC